MDKLEIFFSQLKEMLPQIKDVPMMIWQGVEGQLDSLTDIIRIRF